MKSFRAIITVIAPPGTELNLVLPYLERSGRVELQTASTIYLDAGAWTTSKRLRKKLLLIRSTLQAILHVPIRVGASTAKSVSLVAARQAGPAGIRIVEPGEEGVFLERIVIDLLPGIGRRTATYLRNRGVDTIGKFGRLPQTAAVRLFGVSGIILREFSRGTDPRDVIPDRQPSVRMTGRRSLFSLFGSSPNYSTLGAAANSR